MIHLRRHNSRDYAILPDIDLTDTGRLAPDDLACLDDVGQFLVEKHANERFGVTLLHSHFLVRDDEILVEEAHGDSQCITLRPTSLACPNLVPTSLCFESTDDVGGLIGLEYTYKDALGGVRPLGSHDGDVLASLRKIIFRHAKIGRFGLRLLHDPLKLSERVLLETCDSVGRVLTCRTTAEDDPDFADATPTLFQWKAELSHGSPTVGQGCMQFCKSVRRCAASRNGHQSSSSHDSSHDDRF